MNCSGQEGGPRFSQPHPGFQVHVWLGLKAHWPRIQSLIMGESEHSHDCLW